MGRAGYLEAPPERGSADLTSLPHRPPAPRVADLRPRRRVPVMSLLWYGLAVLALVVAARLTRYTTIGTDGGVWLLDRWSGEVCAVSSPTSRRCLPIR